MLGRGPSRGGCGLSPSASIRRLYGLRTTPAAAVGRCLLVLGGEPFSSFRGAALRHAQLSCWNSSPVNITGREGRDKLMDTKERIALSSSESAFKLELHIVTTDGARK